MGGERTQPCTIARIAHIRGRPFGSSDIAQNERVVPKGVALMAPADGTATIEELCETE